VDNYASKKSPEVYTSQTLDIQGLYNKEMDKDIQLTCFFYRNINLFF